MSGGQWHASLEGAQSGRTLLFSALSDLFQHLGYQVLLLEAHYEEEVLQQMFDD